MKKILSLFFILTLSLVSLLTLTACDKTNAEDLLKTFLIEQDGKNVKEDFSVPSSLTIGEETYDLTWSSNSKNLIIGDLVDTSYEVKVLRPEKEEEAKLTVSLSVSKKNTATKDFKVLLTPINVYDFVDEFSAPGVFKENGTNVTKDFALATEYALAKHPNEKATIVWESNTPTSLAISEDGKTAIVTPTSEEVSVILTAKFTYKGETSQARFKVKVSSPKSPYENLMYWYNNTGITQEISGYVVCVAAEYSESYGNISLYILDDTRQGGYYLYRTKADSTEAAKLLDANGNFKLGTHVTVTGASNTSYNGLLETNAGGNLVVDTDVEPINVEETYYAIDNDFVANAQSLYYRTSTLITLTNWKVVKVGDPIVAGSTSEVLTLEKNGCQIKIMFSKYIQNALGEANAAAFQAGLKDIKVGEYVNVKGLLSYYNTSKEGYNRDSYQILMTAPNSVTKGTADDAELPGVKVGAALEAFDALQDLYVAPKTVQLPTELEGATIAWSIPETSVAKSVALEGNTLKVTPQANLETVNVVGTYTNGAYSTVVYYTFKTQSLDDAQMAEKALEEVSIENQDKANTIELLEESAIYAGVTFSYELKAANAAVALDGNVLTILVPTTETKVTLIVTATSGEATKTKEIEFTIAKGTALDVQTSVVEGTAYKFGFYNANIPGQYFLTGAASGTQYLATTKDANAAADFYVEAVTGGYKIYTLKGETKSYIDVFVAKNSSDKNTAYLQFAESTEEIWTWNAEHNTFLSNIVLDEGSEAVEHYLGTYNSYETMSISKSSYMSTSFPSHFYSVSVLTDEIAIQSEMDVIKFEKAYEETAEIELAYASTYAVAISYEVTEGSEAAVIENGVLTVTPLGPDTDVTIKVTAVCGEKTTTKEYKFTVVGTDPKDPVTIASAVKLEDGKAVVIEGVVESIAEKGEWSDKYGNMSVNLKDATGTILVYRLSTKVEVGDYIRVFGTMGSYNEVKQIAQGATATIYGKLSTIAEATAAEDNTLVVLEGKVTEIKTAWSDQYKNISVFLEDGTGRIQLFRLSANVAVGDYIRVYGKVGSFQGEKQIAQGATALMLGKAASVEEVTKLEDGIAVVLEGTVDSIANKGEWSDQYKNMSVYLKDATGTIQLYRLSTKVEVGQKIRVFGLVGSYKETKQIAQGAYAVVLPAAEEKPSLETTLDVTSFEEVGKLVPNADDKSTEEVLIIGYVKSINTYANGLTLVDAEGNEISASAVKSFDGAISLLQIPYTIENGTVVVLAGNPINSKGAVQLSNATVVQIGKEICTATDAHKVAVTVAELKVKSNSDANFTLPISGTKYSDVTISWSSNDAAIAVDATGNATVTKGEIAIDVILTATVSSGDETETKAFKTNVPDNTPSLVVGTFTDLASNDKTAPEGWTLNVKSGAYGTGWQSFRNNDEYVKTAAFAAQTEVKVFFKYYLNNLQSAEGKSSKVKIEALNAEDAVVATYTSDELNAGAVGTDNAKTISATLTGEGIVSVKITFIKNGGGNIGFSSVIVK